MQLCSYAAVQLPDNPTTRPPDNRQTPTAVVDPPGSECDHQPFLMSLDPVLHERPLPPYAKTIDPAWLRLAADAGSVGFWHLDTLTGLIDCTPRCKANLGIPRDATVSLE